MAKDASHIGLLGMGRMGRNLFRLLHDSADLHIVAVSDAANLETLTYLLRFDTLLGRFPAVIGTGGDGSGTFNISTLSALVVASAGATSHIVIAKRGTRVLKLNMPRPPQADAFQRRVLVPIREFSIRYLVGGREGLSLVVSYREIL